MVDQDSTSGLEVPKTGKIEQLLQHAQDLAAQANQSVEKAKETVIALEEQLKIAQSNVRLAEDSKRFADGQVNGIVATVSTLREIAEEEPKIVEKTTKRSKKA